jgi:hypothetical protein
MIHYTRHRTPLTRLQPAGHYISESLLTLPVQSQTIWPKCTCHRPSRDNLTLHMFCSQKRVHKCWSCILGTPARLEVLTDNRKISKVRLLNLKKKGRATYQHTTTSDPELTVTFHEGSLYDGRSNKYAYTASNYVTKQPTLTYLHQRKFPPSNYQLFQVCSQHFHFGGGGGWRYI